MQIISREHLQGFLTGPSFNPEGERDEEMLAFAAAILAHADPEVAYFVLTDHENGDDPEVRWPDYADLERVDLVPLTYGAQGDYYGLIAERRKWVYAESVPAEQRRDPRVLYHCYLGGCPASSAPGFVISTVVLAE